MKNIFYIVGIMLMLSACESMEDTYAEYNTPKERYVGKVSDVKIEQGWKRFHLSWTNGVDAAIVNIKIKWEDENGIADSVILAPEAVEYFTDTIFSNQSYKFSITAIDSRNKESFPVQVYETPFTEESTVFESLKVVEKKLFLIKDKLILSLYPAGKNIYNVAVTYLSGGKQQVKKITAHDFEKGYVTIDGIDTDTDVSIQGMMAIPECIDSVAVSEYNLDFDKRIWSGSFIGNLRQQFDALDVSRENMDTLSTLYVDYRINSLEDILYLPNLKKVVLGKRRMNRESIYITDTNYVSRFDDVDVTIFALRTMHALTGLEVDIYGNQFMLKDSLDFATVYTKNAPPSIIIPGDVNSWEISYNYYTEYYKNQNPKLNHNYYIEDILGSFKYWESKSSSVINSHEIIYDMKEMKTIKGFQFFQSAATTSENYLPTIVEIFISNDENTWEPAYYQAGYNVGGVIGEVTIEKLHSPKTAQYIKLVVKDIDLGNKKIVAIGNFLPLL